jgi:hypothetical protein
MIKPIVFLSSLLAFSSHGFTIQSPLSSPAMSAKSSRTCLDVQSTNDQTESRRGFFVASSAATLGLVNLVLGAPEEALASGGATAGKYTTIPIAKR